MFFFDLFETGSVPTPRSPFRLDGGPGRAADRDIGMERFASSAVPAEISAARITTSDLSQ